MKLNNATLPKLLLMSSLFLPLLASTAYAQKFTVTIENLTHGSHFTPLLVAAHDANTHLFKTGEMATISLQTMAEGGSISALSSDLTSTGATLSENPAGGLLAPGDKTQTTIINTNGTNNNYLSVVAMVLPSNDGFMGLNSWKIPNKSGSYTLNINAYDAGTEANNELLGATDAGAVGVLGAPGAPSGSAGTNGTGAATEDTNTKVHIHRGILGDVDTAGGISDFDSRVHRWLNPVARITVVVN